MTHTEIECFIAICRHKTVVKAAEALFITQSSVSIRLKNLEKELGGRLFYRKKGSREMLLTDAGERFYALSLQYESLTEEMQSIFKSESKILRVCSLNSLDTYLLPELYDRFLQDYKDIELEINNKDIVYSAEDVGKGNIDLAFTTGDIWDSRLMQTRAFIEPMVIICSASLDIPDGAGPEAFPIKKEVYIEWSSHFGKWHRQTFGETHPQITVSIMAHLKQFMQHRQCWACVPISVAVGLEKTCEIKRVTPDFSLPNREVSLITKWGKTHSAPLSAFFDCLRKALSVYPEINILI